MWEVHTDTIAQAPAYVTKPDLCNPDAPVVNRLSSAFSMDYYKHEDQRVVMAQIKSQESTWEMRSEHEQIMSLSNRDVATETL